MRRAAWRLLLVGCVLVAGGARVVAQTAPGSRVIARDALRRRSAVFAAAIDLYYRSGPAAAAVIARSDATRALVRGLLGPIVDVATAAEAAAGRAVAAPRTRSSERSAEARAP